MKAGSSSDLKAEVTGSADHLRAAREIRRVASHRVVAGVSAMGEVQ